MVCLGSVNSRNAGNGQLTNHVFGNEVTIDKSLGVGNQSHIAICDNTCAVDNLNIIVGIRLISNLDGIRALGRRDIRPFRAGRSDIQRAAFRVNNRNDSTLGRVPNRVARSLGRIEDIVLTSQRIAFDDNGQRLDSQDTLGAAGLPLIDDVVVLAFKTGSGDFVFTNRRRANRLMSQNQFAGQCIVCCVGNTEFYIGDETIIGHAIHHVRVLIAIQLFSIRDDDSQVLLNDFELIFCNKSHIIVLEIVGSFELLNRVGVSADIFARFTSDNAVGEIAINLAHFGILDGEGGILITIGLMLARGHNDVQRAGSDGQSAVNIVELVVVLRLEQSGQSVLADRGLGFEAIAVLAILADGSVAGLSIAKDALIGIAIDEAFHAIVAHIGLQRTLTGLAIDRCDIGDIDGQSCLIDGQGAVVEGDVIILLSVDIGNLEVPAVGANILARFTNSPDGDISQSFFLAQCIRSRKRKLSSFFSFHYRAIAPSHKRKSAGVFGTVGLFLAGDRSGHLAAGNVQGRVVAHEVVVTIGASVLVIDFDRNGIVARSGIYIGIGAHHRSTAKQLFDGDGTGIQFFLVGSRQTGYVPCKFRIGLAVFTAELRLVIVAVFNHRGNDDRILDNVQLCRVESNGIVRVRQAADINIVVTNRRVLVSVRMQTAGQLVAVDKTFCMIG